MARPNRPKRRRSHPRAQALSKLSDEALGRWLADLTRPILERAACEAVGIDAIYSGRNALLEPAESRHAREIVSRLTAVYFNVAIRFERSAAEYLAIWLALAGHYERAGQAFRHSPGLRRVETEQAQAQGASKGRMTIEQTKLLRETTWGRIGRAKRKAEKGRRQSNKDLAQEIWNDCPTDSRALVSTIAQAVPRLGLDKRKWDREKPLSIVRGLRRSALEIVAISATCSTGNPKRFRASVCPFFVLLAATSPRF